MKGLKMVQLIRPVMNIKLSYEETFVDLIQNVDISSCGISWDGLNLYENYPNSIMHAKYKIFSINQSAKMYTNRIYIRVDKLIGRGWVEINGVEIIRDKMIDYLLSDENIPKYIVECNNKQVK